MPTTATRPRRPASTRSGNATAAVAHDLGRRGEDAPSWVYDDPKTAAAYERGVDELDAAGGDPSSDADAPTRDDDDRPAPSRRAKAAATSPTSASAPPKSTGGPGSGGSEGSPARSSPARRSGVRRAVDTLDAAATGPLWGAGDGGGLVLGALVVYPLGMAFLREGPYGVRRWLSAKFVNKVLPPAAGGGAATSAATSPAKVVAA